MTGTSFATSTASAPAGNGSRRAIVASARRNILLVSLLAAVWLLLTDAAMSSWVIGIPAVIAAAWAVSRVATADRAPVSLAGVARFVPFFLWYSVRGGLDVALRTLAPRMRIRPGYVTFRTRLAQSRSRVFMTYSVNLLPGTLTANLDDDRLHIHLLDVDTDSHQDLRRLENHVARIFADETATTGAGDRA